MDFFKNFLHSVLPKRETREPFCLLVLSLSKNPPPFIRPKPPFPRRLLRADIGERKGFCFPQAGDSSTQICSGDRVSLSLSRHGQTGRFRELRALHAPRQDTRAGEEGSVQGSRPSDERLYLSTRMHGERKKERGKKKTAERNEMQILGGQ